MSRVVPEGSMLRCRRGRESLFRCVGAKEMEACKLPSSRWHQKKFFLRKEGLDEDVKLILTK